MPSNDLSVRSINPSLTYDWLLYMHYAKRVPQIRYAFGLYLGTILIGCVTYGLPASNNLRIGVAGREWRDTVIELNRLVVLDGAPRNSASMLVGRSLKLLPKPTIVVSYADTGQGHIGYIYQATNFLYTGLSQKHKDVTVAGLESFHQRSVTRGKTKDEMISEFGDTLYYIKRSRKHRYIYVVADRCTKAKIIKSLKYKILPYPKGNSVRYDTGNALATQQVLF